MKKFQTLMLVMLVALTSMSIQSCGSDDDNNSSSVANYTITGVLTDNGDLTAEEIKAMEAQLAPTSATITADLNSAKKGVDQAAQKCVDMIKPELENQKNTKKFTISYILKEDASGKEVYRKSIRIDGTSINIL